MGVHAILTARKRNDETITKEKSHNQELILEKNARDDQLNHNVVGGWRGFQPHVYQVNEGPVRPSTIWKASRV